MAQVSAPEPGASLHVIYARNDHARQIIAGFASAMPIAPEMREQLEHALAGVPAMGDVAAILAIPERTVRDKWRQWGLPAYRIGKHLRWRERDVYAWLERQSSWPSAAESDQSQGRKRPRPPERDKTRTL